MKARRQEASKDLISVDEHLVLLVVDVALHFLQAVVAYPIVQVSNPENQTGNKTIKTHQQLTKGNQ